MKFYGYQIVSQQQKNAHVHSIFLVQILTLHVKNAQLMKLLFLFLLLNTQTFYVASQDCSFRFDLVRCFQLSFLLNFRGISW